MNRSISAALMSLSVALAFALGAAAQSCPTGTTQMTTAYGSYCAQGAPTGGSASSQTKPELLDEHSDDPLYNKMAAAYNELMKLPSSPPVESLETPHDRETYNVLTIKSRTLAAYAAAVQEMFARENENFRKFRDLALKAGDNLYQQGYRQALLDVAKKVQESGYRYSPSGNFSPQIVCHTEYEYPDSLKTVCK